MSDPYLSPPPAQRPAGPDQWRPSDADRQPIFQRLRQAVDEGRLDLMEYDSRLRATEQATTLAELERVVSDLPVPPEAVLVQIGELAVTASTVYTPVGPIPLHGSQWTVQDQWLSEQKIPSWAIVLAILLFFCVGPLSLLLLLVKEATYRGHVQVTVSSGNRQYVAYIPVRAAQQVQYVHQQVNYARSIASR